MAENLIKNIADSVGLAAREGASNALKNVSTNDLVQTAIIGAQSGLNQLTPSIDYKTQMAPINYTSSSSPSRVTFSASGNPTSGQTTIAEKSSLVSEPRDSNGRLYVLNTPLSSSYNVAKFNPPGSSGEDANLIALQLAQEAPTLDPVQEAILYGPEALRRRPVAPLAVKIPVDSTNMKATDDGMKPHATPPPVIYGARVEREDSGGWPAGFRIEDRSKYGPQGDMARDTIPASVVSAIAGGNSAGSAEWFIRISLALALIFLILYIVKRVIDERKQKKTMEKQEILEVEPSKNQ